jgi:hypothetical protein
MHHKVNVDTLKRIDSFYFCIYSFYCLSLSVKKQGQAADLCEYSTEISFYKIRVIA